MPRAGAIRPRLRTRSRIAVATLALAVAAVAPAAATAARRPGVWVTPAELQRLPERGPAWRQLVELSHERLGRADLSDQDSDHDVRVLATAMVAARTDDDRLRDRAAAGIMAAVGTERGGRTLALARGLISYVVAADLIDLRHHDAGKERVFRAWLRRVRRERLEPHDYPTLILTHELRPNNWGTHAGASRIAADIYLGDRKDLARAAAVFKGWLGDRRIYDGFVYGGRSWQADPKEPVGVNPPGTTRGGVAVGGALPDDMRRGCPPRDPPCPTGYPWEAMQGAVAQAEMLYRQGYDAWRWGDDGLRRAADRLFALARRTGEEDWHAAEDDGWIPWLLNARYGTRFPTRMPALPGKGMGFTDWTAPIQRDARLRGAALPVAPVKAHRPPASRIERATGSVPAILVVGVAALALGLLVGVLRKRTAARRAAPRGDAERRRSRFARR